MLHKLWFKVTVCFNNLTGKSALISHIYELEHDLFESKRFEELASGKLTTWVNRHDDLLIKHKALVERFKTLHPDEQI